MTPNDDNDAMSAYGDNPAHGSHRAVSNPEMSPNSDTGNALPVGADNAHHIARYSTDEQLRIFLSRHGWVKGMGLLNDVIWAPPWSHLHSFSDSPIGLRSAVDLQIRELKRMYEMADD